MVWPAEAASVGLGGEDFLALPGGNGLQGRAPAPEGLILLAR